MKMTFDLHAGGKAGPKELERRSSWFWGEGRKELTDREDHVSGFCSVSLPEYGCFLKEKEELRAKCPEQGD